MQKCGTMIETESTTCLQMLISFHKEAQARPSQSNQSIQCNATNKQTNQPNSSSCSLHVCHALPVPCFNVKVLSKLRAGVSMVQWCHQTQCFWVHRILGERNTDLAPGNSAMRATTGVDKGERCRSGDTGDQRTDAWHCWKWY